MMQWIWLEEWLDDIGTSGAIVLVFAFAAVVLWLGNWLATTPSGLWWLCVAISVFVIRGLWRIARATYRAARRGGAYNG